MNAANFAWAIAIGPLLASATMAEPPKKVPEVVTIPLDQIWAYNMPGTKRLEKVEDRRSAKELREIRTSLSTTQLKRGMARAGFVVVGEGIGAVQGAHAVLVEGKKAPQQLPADTEISLVFFSCQFGRYVQLQKVVRDDNVIEVQYQFIPHKSKEVTQHFALIPLGKMVPGNMRVKITQVPMAREFVSAGWQPVQPDTERRIVCQPFSFDVEKQKLN